MDDQVREAEEPLRGESGRGGGGGMNWEIGMDTYTLICIKWVTNKNLLYKKLNKIQKLKKKRYIYKVVSCKWMEMQNWKQSV